MSDWDGILGELRAMRVQLDQMAARVMSEKAREDLLPVWVCGHRHAGREEAAKCRRDQLEADAVFCSQQCEAGENA